MSVLAIIPLGLLLMGSSLPIQIGECVELALKNNMGLRIEQEKKDLIDQDIATFLSAYTLSQSWSLFLKGENRLSASTVADAQTKEGSAGFQWNLKRPTL